MFFVVVRTRYGKSRWKCTYALKLGSMGKEPLWPLAVRPYSEDKDVVARRRHCSYPNCCITTASGGLYEWRTRHMAQAMTVGYRQHRRFVPRRTRSISSFA